MIGMLTGSIYTCQKSPLTLTVGGVGYEVNVPPGVLSQLVAKNSITLFTHTHVREDILELYGFLNAGDLQLFKLLLTVSGIGPKTALLIIDRGEVNIRQAISSSDVDFFTSIPRLGKKNAQKIIIELKTKLGSVKELDLSEATTGETKELIEAMISMGFARAEVVVQLKKLDQSDVTIEQKIRHLLKLLSRPTKKT